MRYKNLVSMVTIAIGIFMAEANAGEKVFSPSFCEFSVTFPNGYKPKEMISATATGAAATGRAGSTGLSAECWPYEQQAPIQTYARELASQMRQRGGIVDNVARYGSWKRLRPRQRIIVRSPAEGLTIAAGDVLVAPSTDPAWTPPIPQGERADHGDGRLPFPWRHRGVGI